MQKITLLDSTGDLITIDGKLVIVPGSSKESDRLKADILSIQEEYKPKGIPMTGLSFEFLMALIQRKWKVKEFRSLTGAAEEFLENASSLADLGHLSEKQLISKDKLDQFFSHEARQKIMFYRMSTLSLAFACEAYINQYGADRLGTSEFESFDRLPVEDKWIVIPKVATGRTFDKGSEPYQTLKRLITTRNDWVHHKASLLCVEPGVSSKTIGKVATKIPDDYNAIAAQIVRVRELIAELHTFDGSSSLLYVD
jgi:hypothetical protein